MCCTLSCQQTWPRCQHPSCEGSSKRNLPSMAGHNVGHSVVASSRPLGAGEEKMPDCFRPRFAGGERLSQRSAGARASSGSPRHIPQALTIDPPILPSTYCAAGVQSQSIPDVPHQCCAAAQMVAASEQRGTIPQRHSVDTDRARATSYNCKHSRARMTRD